MTRKLLLGNEAIAQGALDAGISGVYGYPGTPSTEIMEYIQQAPERAKRTIHAEWSVNEKTAFEEALGMAYAGRRVVVCMKHVGLNVAADPFMNAAVTGVNGGLVLVVADDPSMHSSQNEQDSRYYAQFAQIPLYEPSNQQEGYAMIGEAFNLSEIMNVPVMIRITTRLAHSRADVTMYDEARSENYLSIPHDNAQFILLPANARRNYKVLVEKQPLFEKSAEESRHNFYQQGDTTKLGIIAAGITYNYLKELFQDAPMPYSVLKLSQYPLPRRRIQHMLEKYDEVLVLEEGMPFIEEKLRGFTEDSGKIRGRMDETLPRTGELNPDEIARALGMDVKPLHWIPSVVTMRPPGLCKGCPHCDSYEMVNDVVRDFPTARVFADIGCYTLGALAPYYAIHTCVDMGASITMAKGASDAGVRPAIAVIGDSTFTHSGITGLLDLVYEKSPVTVLILDNDITAMTGGQVSLAAGGKLEKICTGVGVDPAHIRVIEAHRKNHAANVAVMKEEIAFDGVSVVISRRACIQKR